jgi:hypothetical protein
MPGCRTSIAVVSPTEPLTVEQNVDFFRVGYALRNMSGKRGCLKAATVLETVAPQVRRAMEPGYSNAVSEAGEGLMSNELKVPLSAIVAESSHQHLGFHTLRRFAG